MKPQRKKINTASLDGTANPYAVVSHDFNGHVCKLTVALSGTRSACLTYIRQLVRRGRPTHFLSVIANSQHAANLLRRKLKIPESTTSTG